MSNTSMTPDPFWTALTSRIAAEVPGFSVAYKADVWWMRWLAVLFRPFNKNFGVTYVTTIGKRAFYPTLDFVSSDPPRAARILAHELVHILDEIRMGRLLYRVLYLLPQILVILALFSVLGLILKPLWVFVSFLLALAPWPSPGRVYLERRGALMDLAVRYWMHGPQALPPVAPEWVVKRFNGGDYYWMSWSSTATNQWYAESMGLLTGPDWIKWMSDPQNRSFVIVREVLKATGLLQHPLPAEALEATQ